jgi:hypothetical protein
MSLTDILELPWFLEHL